MNIVWCVWSQKNQCDGKPILTGIYATKQLAIKAKTLLDKEQPERYHCYEDWELIDKELERLGDFIGI